MARSEEAILRRALKRERTEGEQRYADRLDMKQNELKLKQKFENKNYGNKRLRVSKPPIHHQEGNRRENSSRNVDSNDNSSDHKTNSRGRRIPIPSEAPRRRPSSLSRTNKTKHQRHDVETSKKLVWARQSDTKVVSKNQELRQRYRETGGEGMDEDDIRRAKLLIARDQRKQEKRKKKEKTVNDKDANITASKESSDATPKEDRSSNKKSEVLTQEETTLHHEHQESRKKTEQSTEAQAKRDQNKALRMLFFKTGGKGMKGHQIERAKLLIARDEKKRKKRFEMRKKK
mmetsp:Transcript_17223/g.39805  ORF Transcript_17223/g.39805 Transcript_17223/m.39805 type:complete len:289 (-) Transcript_17223:206-1072(-)|eukprot:CAMPEP_0197178240 /NCGR_PEP_ID=MMETSP1423-20130617/3591_1 /TAXON_ID=476441 /ORGANISM="Pseudo-nitzschia heimii, Strain UNC1101" /LENGTH=288 /DNA_ID=CAMNT_0042627947 /DNA_START=127 /DNA_END=993 /DNA_ORIENTATION=+